MGQNPKPGSGSLSREHCCPAKRKERQIHNGQVDIQTEKNEDSESGKKEGKLY